jgi:hypothetical protein
VREWLHQFDAKSKWVFGKVLGIKMRTKNAEKCIL